MKAKKQFKYPGRLGQNVQLREGPPDNAITGYSSLEEANRSDQPFEDAVLLLLMEHFNISPDSKDCWRSLALELAKQHVPAFQRQIPSGRPTKWHVMAEVAAKLCIDRFMAEHPAHSMKSAAAAVAKQAAWKRFLGTGKDSGEQIRQAYFRPRPDEVAKILELAEELESNSPGANGLDLIVERLSKRW